jgi:hypothetical protein
MKPSSNVSPDDGIIRDGYPAGVLSSMELWNNTTDDRRHRAISDLTVAASMKPWHNGTDDRASKG